MPKQVEEPLFDYKIIPLTEKIHKRAYPAILPDRSSLSQAGRTVLITGGSAGIGHSIAKAFAVAGASRIIIVGRDVVKFQGAVDDLQKESAGSNTRFEGRECHISEPESIDKLWDGLAADGIHVDVLVLNAAMTGLGKMWELEWQWVWRQFEVNVRAHHQFCHRLAQQPTSEGKQVRNRGSWRVIPWVIRC